MLPHAAHSGVSIDFTATMLEELEKVAQELTSAGQAVIKTLIRQALDQHYTVQAARAWKNSA
ncbi:MAG TPA: hypothetical protein VKM93_17470 [Terriglobia bacterium]|nr:hypothetical protein [Terriglobia bacterium]